MRAVRWAWAPRHYAAAIRCAERVRDSTTIDYSRERGPTWGDTSVAARLVERLKKAGPGLGVKVSHAQLRVLHENLSEDESSEVELREILDEAVRLADAGVPMKERVERSHAFLDAMLRRP